MVTTRTTKQVQNADAKYINAILYFSANANNKWFGTKKLAKMLYELDFDVYEEQGQSLTGDTYVKEKYGPLPKRFYDILRKMRDEGYLMYEPKAIDFNSYKKDLIEAQRDFDPTVFTAQELETLQKVTSKWLEFSAKNMENISHYDAPWLCAKQHREELDYNLAPYRFGRNEEDEEPDEFDKALMNAGLFQKAADEFAG